MSNEKKETLGQMSPPRALVMHQYVGEAKDPDTGREYEMMQTLNGSPMISSKLTGRVWSLGWQKLIELAVAEGVDLP